MGFMHHFLLLKQQKSLFQFKSIIIMEENAWKSVISEAAMTVCWNFAIVPFYFKIFCHKLKCIYDHFALS